MRAEKNEMYKTNFRQRLWRGCIHIINNIKFNKQSFREKKKCTNEQLRGEESSA